MGYARFFGKELTCWSSPVFSEFITFSYFRFHSGRCWLWCLVDKYPRKQALKETCDLITWLCQILEFQVGLIPLLTQVEYLICFSVTSCNNSWYACLLWISKYLEKCHQHICLEWNRIHHKLLLLPWTFISYNINIPKTHHASAKYVSAVQYDKY